MRVHAVGSIPGWAGTGASGNSFIVTEPFGGGRAGCITAEAKGKIIAVTLRGGAGGKAAEDDVGDALRLMESGVSVYRNVK